MQYFRISGWRFSNRALKQFRAICAFLKYVGRSCFGGPKVRFRFLRLVGKNGLYLRRLGPGKWQYAMAVFAPEIASFYSRIHFSVAIFGEF
jgi:hypothetical protein